MARHHGGALPAPAIDSGQKRSSVVASDAGLRRQIYLPSPTCAAKPMTLFDSIHNNSHHVLRHLLPPPSQAS